MRNVTVSMIVNGVPVRKIAYQGKTFLPVEVGQEFTIKIDNNSNYDLLAVASVDGLSVRDGQEANHDGLGYIVPAHQSRIIDGWRTSLDTVRTFRIGPEGTSYAEKRSDVSSANRGVIGVVLYRRRQILREFRDRSLDALPSCEWKTSGLMFNACSTPQEVGTQWGDTKQSKVRRMPFKRDLESKSVVVLYYDTVNALREKGVPVDAHVGLPNPFPAETQECFCPSPK